MEITKKVRELEIPKILENVKNSNRNFYGDNYIYADDLKNIESNGPVNSHLNMLVLCIKGQFTMDVNGKTTTMHEGQAFVSHSNVILDNYRFSNDFEGKALGITDSLMHRILGNNINLWIKTLYQTNINLVDIDAEANEVMKNYHSIIMRKLNAPVSTLRNEILEATMRAGVLDFLYLLGTRDDEASQFTHGKKLFNNFLDLLSNSEIKRHPVDYYATQLCVSPKYLSSVCHNVAGKSASILIHEYVCEDIRHYMVNTTMSIKEIADLLHFPNTSFFSKFVKQHFGVTPKDLRNGRKATINALPEEETADGE